MASPSPKQKQQKLIADLDEAKRFLAFFRTDRFFFQTFDDDKQRQNGALIHSFRNCTIDSAFKELSALNNSGAGVYFCVNEIDPKTTRKTENVTAVRAHFVDLDGAPVMPILQCKLKPDILVETRTGRFHAYWMLVEKIKPNRLQFRSIQKAIATRFNGDQSVNDLPRVMRVPGFYNLKNPELPEKTKLINNLLNQYVPPGK